MSPSLRRTPTLLHTHCTSPAPSPSPSPPPSSSDPSVCVCRSESGAVVVGDTVEYAWRRMAALPLDRDGSCCVDFELECRAA